LLDLFCMLKGVDLIYLNQLMHITDWLPTFYAAAGIHSYYTAHTVHDKLTSLLKLVLGCNNM
jgi:hypothetical protein